MNCPSCRHEPPSGSQFCNRCGAPLELRCPSCDNTIPPGSQFCNSCGHSLAPSSATTPPERTPRDYTPKHLADKILQSKSALEGERKQVTVLFADVKGSMELAEQVDAEEWHRILDRFFQILADGVHRFEGTVNQYTGDGIMALFGAPIAHEDHAQRACWAALYLRAELGRYADELRRRGVNFSVRMGLNSGEVVVGKIGDDLRMDYTAQGQTVGLAQRVEQTAAADTAYVTSHTADLVEGFFELRDLGAFELKGAAEPLHVFELEGVGALRTRLDRSRARGFTRFVGRGGEMATLESALAQAEEGHGQVVGVVGEAGVGKSRLCLEFVERCRARGIAVYEGHCPAHGKVVPFIPLLELLRAYFGIEARDGAEEARRKIAGTLLLLDDALREVLPLVFDFLGVPDPAHPTLRMDPDARQHQLVAFVRRLFEAPGAGPPDITLVDDLHWIDPGSDAFLAHIVEALGRARSLLLLNFRPEYRAAWMQRSHYQQLPLMPLGKQATDELLAELLGRDPSLSELTQRIDERAGGNPFFAEELVQTLAEAGSLEGVKGAYRLARSIEGLELPATVQALLAARIDRLGAREKQLLQRASVIGKQIPEPVLRRVAALPDEELTAALAALTEAELLYERTLYPQIEYSFRHPLTHEVAYGTQLSESRQGVHAAVARAIEELEPAKLDERAALLARHWEEAGESLEAARWHRRAAQWAGTNDVTEAIRHWRRVRELLGADPVPPEAQSLALEACRRILDMGWRMGSPQEETAEVFAEGLELAGKLGDAGTRAQILVGYADQRWALAGDADEAVALAREALELVEGTGDRELQSYCHQSVASFLNLAGRPREALPFADRGLELAVTDGKLSVDAIANPNTFLHVYRGDILISLARLKEGAEEIVQGLELARAQGDREGVAYAKLYLALLALVRGDFDAQLRWAREIMDLAERLGNPMLRIMASNTLAVALVRNEQWREARDVAEQVWSIARFVPYTAPWNRSAAALASAGLGDVANARSAAEEALDYADRFPSLRWGAAYGRLYAAEVLLSIDGRAVAERVERELDAVEAVIEEGGIESHRPLLHERRAQLADVRGDGATHQRELREAHRFYTEMGATGHARRLAEELGL